MSVYHFDQNDIKKFMMGKYTECKISDYIHLKENDVLYTPINSNIQIYNILSANDLYLHLRLYQLLTKWITYDDYNKIVKYAVENKSDKNIYIEIRKYINKYLGKPNSIPRKKGNIKYTKCKPKMIVLQDINFFLKSHIEFSDRGKLYIDIGCGDCTKTKAIGNFLGFDNDNIYGADIEEWGGYSMENRKLADIKFIGLKIDEIFPIDTSKFDLVSLLMVLHHIKNLDLFLKEIYRIMKNNSILLIKEHDSISAYDKMLNDIEHGLYEVTLRNNLTYFDSYYGKYYDKIEWSIILEKYGFEFIAAENYYPSIREDITPTRYYYAIYRKSTTSTPPNNQSTPLS